LDCVDYTPTHCVGSHDIALNLLKPSCTLSPDATIIMSTFRHTVYLCVSHDYHTTYFENSMKRSVFLTDADCVYVCVCVFRVGTEVYI
jgi:hypothetical protein